MTKSEGKGLLEEEAIRSIGFLVDVREGLIEGRNINHRIAAAKILMDKVFASGGDKADKGDNVVRIEVIDLTAPESKTANLDKITEAEPADTKLKKVKTLPRKTSLKMPENKIFRESIVETKVKTERTSAEKQSEKISEIRTAEPKQQLKGAK